MGNPVVHFEIGCRDSKKTQEFYSNLFDWKLEAMGPAVMINTGEAVAGHITALGHEPHHYTIFYVQVDDVQACLDQAKARRHTHRKICLDAGSRRKYGWPFQTGKARVSRYPYERRSKIPAAPMQPPTHMVTIP